VDTSEQSKALLNSIAGGNYWEAIVRDYQADRLTGYEAEKRFSTEYKQRLRKQYTYVLDMPIRMKPGQRPKYRMVHVCNHEQGCNLMADNMAARKDELFVDVQSNGQLSLFDQTMENDIIGPDEIHQKMSGFLKNFPAGITVDKLLAAFYTEFGVLCKSGEIKKVLRLMETTREISVVRDPDTTESGKKSTSFTEKGMTITIKKVSQ